MAHIDTVSGRSEAPPPHAAGHATRRERVRLFWHYWRRRSIVLRGLRVAAAITPILIAINHYPAIAAGRLDAQFWFQVALTFAVPYCVSTYSSAMTAVADHLRSERGESV